MNESDSQGNPLGYAPVSRLIVRFAIPSIISMLVNAAYNITDQIFIGHIVGMLGNAATNVAFPAVTLSTALAQLIGIGTAANFNINMGAKKENEAKNFLYTGLSLMVIVSVIYFTVLYLFKTDILILCGATSNVMPFAQKYLGITSIGIPFLLFTISASNLIRADSSPAYSMACTVTGAILNVFLDWLFMFIFKLGIEGAAIATITGQFISFLLCIAYFPRFKAFRLSIALLRPKSAYIGSILKLGTANFINLAIIMIVNIIMNNTLKHYGAGSVYGSDIPLAVSGIVAKLNSILQAFSVGLAHGCQPILGFNMGAGNYKRVKETCIKAVSTSVCISIIFFAMFQLFPRNIVAIFGSGEELYFEFAEKYLRIFMFLIVAYAIQPLAVNYFTGTGNVKSGILLSISRQGLFLIPLLLILPAVFGIEGALYAGPISDLFACTLSISMVLHNFRQISSKGYGVK